MGNSQSQLKYHEKLGEGDSCEVFRVTWTTKDHGDVEAAAKKMSFDEKSKGEEFSGSFTQEIKYLRQLEHVNIIRYYDTIWKSPHVIIITEYASKGSLFDILRGKQAEDVRLPTELVQKWGLHLIRGIEFIQQNNVVHRDIKSPNCVISADDTLKICDFGIAKDLTKTKTTQSERGTVRWLAPEVFTEGKLSPKADVYAFGIVLWELHSCEEPYKDMRQETVMYRVGKDNLRPEIPADCPAAMRTLMEKCWHVDREQRPSNRHIVEQLEKLTS